MSVETHVRDARVRAEAEREGVEETLTAVERFAATVREIDPAGGADSHGPGPVTDGGVTPMAGLGSTPPSDRCERVRDAFAETVQPTLDGDSSVTAAMSDQFSAEVALALAPETEHRFTPAVKRSVLAAAGERRSELDALRDALEREAASLASIREDVDDVLEWLAAADETPLSDVGFERLRARHERLAGFRDRCDALARERQALVVTTTSNGVAGIPHRSVVHSLYEDFPVTYPALSTLATLGELCTDCQATVRDHLTRRV